MRGCAVEGCHRPHKCRGLCGTHYQRRRVTGTVELIVRPPATCSAPDCDSKVLAKGLCVLHYQRLARLGTFDLPVRPTLEEKVRSLYVVDEVSGCWLWQGRPGKNGYGVLTFEAVQMYAHRAAYELFVGPIPEGLTIDHLCRVRICCNPSHLEPVTRSENTRRELAFRHS